MLKIKTEGNYSAGIVSDNVKSYLDDNTNTYLTLTKNAEYSVFISNDLTHKSQAALYIDGKLQGKWILDSFQKAQIERPDDNAKKFTFLELDSEEGRQAQLQDNSELGLVEVVFTPEKQFTPLRGIKSEMGTLGGYGMMSAQSKSPIKTNSVSAGGTGLGQHSNQEFRRGIIGELDYSKTIKISFRLMIEKETKFTPLSSAPERLV